MDPADPLSIARDAFERRAWSEAYDCFAVARDTAPLPLDYIDRFAVVALLPGRDAESTGLLSHGYREALKIDDGRRAAMFAFWPDGGFRGLATWHLGPRRGPGATGLRRHRAPRRR